jgi:hypothetical protein
MGYSTWNEWSFNSIAVTETADPLECLDLSPSWTRCFASSWISHGVDLQRLFFICSANPVKELRPIFLEDTFKRIIIDAPLKFSTGDMAFVSQQARKQGQIVFLIRHYFLTAKRGNPHASLRINTWQSGKRAFSLQFIKGPKSGRISLPYRSVAEDHEHYN